MYMNYRWSFAVVQSRRSRQVHFTTCAERRFRPGRLSGQNWHRGGIGPNYISFKAVSRQFLALLGSRSGAPAANLRRQVWRASGSPAPIAFYSSKTETCIAQSEEGPFATRGASSFYRCLHGIYILPQQRGMVLGLKFGSIILTSELRREVPNRERPTVHPFPVHLTHRYQDDSGIYVIGA